VLDFIFQHETKDLYCTIEYDILEPHRFSLVVENAEMTDELAKDLKEVAWNILKNHIEHEHWIELC
jgi:hypothetical protein